MSAICNVYEDFLQDTKMISEDYISKEAIGSSAWKGPLSKKHNKAILATFVIALTLSIATNKNFYSTSEDTDSSSNSNMLAYSDEHVSDIDDSVPLTQAYGITSNKDKTRQMENYDDSLPDADLADSDAQLDKEVSALAKKIDKDQSSDIDTKWVTESVQRGDNISSLFEDLNIPAATLMAILDTDKSLAKRINSLKIGENLSFLVDGKGELLVFIKPISDKEQLRFYKTDKSGNYTVVKERLGSYEMDDDATSQAKLMASKEAPDAKTAATASASKTDTAKDTKVAAVKDEPVQEMSAAKRGRLVLVNIGKGESFSTAANKAGITYTEINKILQMFKGKIQFSRNIRAGDSMRVLFTESKGKGKICAVEFTLSRGGKVASYLNTADGKYYDERGLKPARSAGFARFPFHSRVRVTSPFNPRRLHPVTGRVRPHNGVDFGMPVGSLISAPSDGVVDKAGFSRSAGYFIVLRHSSTVSTVYMHLSKLSVRPGQRVKQGATIARSGNTGISTGPHLHYEVRIGGRAVNPLRVKLDNQRVELNSKSRKAFATSIKKYKRELYQQSLMAKR
ncbi:MAG TPA: peptidoglycan DD-metalloendopeptidase family protein [Succinivibrionaceae bacterium]|nr:peptidoglycan DD-metalloendopeptidase family protein [Succinivibrionaceae bacterium]